MISQKCRIDKSIDPHQGELMWGRRVKDAQILKVEVGY